VASVKLAPLLIREYVVIKIIKILQVRRDQPLLILVLLCRPGSRAAGSKQPDYDSENANPLLRDIHYRSP
jgi:hypothetical protein